MMVKSNGGVLHNLLTLHIKLNMGCRHTCSLQLGCTSFLTVYVVNSVIIGYIASCCAKRLQKCMLAFL